MDPEKARARLDDEEQRLRALREQAGETVAEDTRGRDTALGTSELHAADQAANLHDRQVNESVAEGLDNELAAVTDARRRLDEGTYGTCEECGVTIPDERLELVPAARYCAEHQPETEPSSTLR